MLALCSLPLLAACYASHEVEPPGTEGGICRPSCADSSECGLGWECTAEGLCESVGCASDADCPPTHACRSSGIRADGTLDCQLRCRSDADCESRGEWGTMRCAEGACVWRGCPSDAWCTEIGRAASRNPATRWACVPQPSGLSRCEWICDTDAGCANDAYDAPLVCRRERCAFASCETDAQCDEWFRAFAPVRFRCVRG